jgi:ankyrin repeat protein
LERLPKGSDALDYAYQEAMERIRGQKPGFQELAKQVLSWITCAKRPLTTLELRHALAVEEGESELDRENLPEIEDIVSVCAGLVTVDEESDIIRLVHYTTQKYFERTQMICFPNAQKDIAKICITYLLFDVFDTGFCLTDEEFDTRLWLNPLYDYAAQNWGHHIRSTSAEGEQLVLDLLESETKISGSSQAMMASKRYTWETEYTQELPRQMRGGHVAACFGLTEAMVALFKNRRDLNVEDTYGRTPLWWAAGYGHETVLKLLLAKDGIDPDSKDQYGRTPLSCAAERGHEAVLKLLLAKDCIDPDSKDKYGQTPLSWAAENGHDAVVKLLLEQDGADPNSKDKSDRTPLLLAAATKRRRWMANPKYEAVIKLLLANNCVIVNTKDTGGRTPLSWVAGEGHYTRVKLLLAKDGTDRNSKDDLGQTPLWWATKNGHEGVIKMLTTNP